jgi:citrate lyase subunit beta/citryl-CoA lyase
VTFELGPALLFCPADRPDRYAKASERADAVILDLEDAVSPADKAAARQALLGTPLDPSRTIVRVNPAGGEHHPLDLAALRATAYRTVMLAKTARVADLDGLSGFDVIALCETAAGVLAAPRIATADPVVALMWGAEDLLASLGGTSSRGPSGVYRDVAVHSRARVLLAAGAAGKAAIDAVHLDIADRAGLEAAARDAAASGFRATACIHPAQVDIIRAAYAPGDEELEHARAILRAAAGERGVFTFRGAMVDEPVLAHARRVLARSR